jgi:two-component system phosphate regulon sensor histidine kinase PhoR
MKYLKIVINSSLHLQSVIEDALDISRIENNKFTLFKEFFDIRAAISEVCDVMKFQFNAKGLEFELDVSDRVPQKIFSDVKRYR